MKNLKVLITAGPTWTPIDDVRVISNISSGQMGHLIAEAFVDCGAKVTLLQGPVTHPMVHKKIKIFNYVFFDQLAALLNKELVNKYDVIIHAAAVSDFKVKRVSKTKLSSGKELDLNLVPTPKLINIIKSLSPESFLVGFKLESRLNLKNVYATVKPLFTQAGCDVVVANSITNGYQGVMMDADGHLLAKATDKKDIARHLVKWCL